MAAISTLQHSWQNTCRAKQTDEVAAELNHCTNLSDFLDLVQPLCLDQNRVWYTSDFRDLIQKIREDKTEFHKRKKQLLQLYIKEVLCALRKSTDGLKGCLNHGGGKNGTMKLRKLIAITIGHNESKTVVRIPQASQVEHAEKWINILQQFGFEMTSTHDMRMPVASSPSREPPGQDKSPLLDPHNHWIAKEAELRIALKPFEAHDFAFAGQRAKAGRLGWSPMLRCITLMLQLAAASRLIVPRFNIDKHPLGWAALTICSHSRSEFHRLLAETFPRGADQPDFREALREFGLVAATEWEAAWSGAQEFVCKSDLEFADSCIAASD